MEKYLPMQHSLHTYRNMFKVRRDREFHIPMQLYMGSVKTLSYDKKLAQHTPNLSRRQALTESRI